MIIQIIGYVISSRRIRDISTNIILKIKHTLDLKCSLKKSAAHSSRTLLRGGEPRPKTKRVETKQILSSRKNSFALSRHCISPRHTARISLRAEPQRKMYFPFSKKIGRAQIRKARNIFLWGCRVKRGGGGALDRKSTRLNSSHMSLSYAVF